MRRLGAAAAAETRRHTIPAGKCGRCCRRIGREGMTASLHSQVTTTRTLTIVVPLRRTRILRLAASQDARACGMSRGSGLRFAK